MDQSLALQPSLPIIFPRVSYEEQDASLVLGTGSAISMNVLPTGIATPLARNDRGSNLGFGGY